VVNTSQAWSLSTAKPGNGVDELRDGSVDTYWQSDGACPSRTVPLDTTKKKKKKEPAPTAGGQPHLINVQFRKKMAISEIAFYLDYALDESYTPKKMSIRCGTTFHDLVEVRAVELHEPTGWVVVPLAPTEPGMAHLRTFFVQICVVSMHQNGRDTHVRQVRIFGPRTPVDVAVDVTGLGFRHTQLARYAVLR